MRAQFLATEAAYAPAVIIRRRVAAVIALPIKRFWRNGAHIDANPAPEALLSDDIRLGDSGVVSERENTGPAYIADWVAVDVEVSGNKALRSVAH